MKLPTTKTPVIRELSRLSVLLYGQPKIGKTTWAAHSPAPFFLATEAGLNHVEAYQVPVRSWEELLEACAALAKGNGKLPYKSVVIDTVDYAFAMCKAYVCKKQGIADPGDLKYGKGFGLVNAEFQRVLTRLSQLPYGLFLISHSNEMQVEARTGTYTKMVPTLPGKARKIVLALVDVVLYAHTHVEKTPTGEAIETRVVETKPSSRWEAGDRTGRLPERLELDYAAFEAAWNAIEEGGE